MNFNEDERKKAMKTSELKIDGMSCGHCVMSVRKELSKIQNLQVEDVQIGSARVSYDDAKVTSSDLSQAVQEAGYRLVGEN